MATTKKKPIIDPSTMSEKEKRDFLLAMRRASGSNNKKKKLPAPTTDDELWNYIQKEYGYEIPRVAVCEDHTAPFDYVADYYFERENALLVLGGRESAKCISGDSLIYDVVNGNRITVEEAINSDILSITSMDDNGNIVVNDVDAKWYTGEKQCYRVTTVSGRSIDVTPEHKFMTQDGWQRTDEISIGDAIATPAFLPFHRLQYEIPDSDLTLLAGLLSEGSISQVQTGFSTSDKQFLFLMTNASEEVKHRNNYDYAIIRSIGAEKRNPVSKMLSEYGIDYLLAKNKFIPEVIFKLNKYQLAKFISIFWMADGTIEQSSISMALSSEQLIKDFQHLLLKFGIQSRYKYRIAKFNKKEYDSWKLEIYGNHIEKFANSFMLWGQKKERLAKLVEKNRCPSAGRPPLTSSLLKYLKNRIPQRKRGTGKQRTIEAYEQLGWKPERSFGTRVLTRGKVKNLQARRLRALCYAHKLDESEFSVLLNEDLWWDFVVDIQDVGVKKVYDVTVLSTETFVANDIIVHNTLNTAIANCALAETKSGCEVCTFADIEAQSNKSYSYIKSFIYYIDNTGKKVPKPIVQGDPKRKETVFKNGSKLEVIIGTISGVNSPHPQKVHADEVDLIDEEIWNESRNMSSSKKLPDGTIIKAQDIATSTLKSTKGLMQKLMDESAKAEKEGLKPTWKVYKSCVYEVAQEASNCRSAPKELRETRLKELGKDSCELCECDKVVKGEWAEGMSRTLQSVCKGKFFKSRGWMAYDDVVRKFVQNSPNKWASQLECRRPMADGLYLPTWNREKFCVRGYEPRPEYGLIWMGVDWGGAHNSAVLWIQGPLHQPIQVNNTIGTMTIIPQGGYVIFKELNEAAMGATRLADKVVQREIGFRNRYGNGWRIKARFADMAGRQQREDWREHNPPLKTSWYISRDFEPTVECVQSLVADNLLYVDDQNAPATCDDFESWRMKDGKEVQDESTHNPAAARYALKNITTIVKRYRRSTLDAIEPIVVGRESYDNLGAIAVSSSGGENGDIYGSEKWRQSLGGPAAEIGGSRSGREPWMP